MTQNSTPGLELGIRKEPGWASEDKGHVSGSDTKLLPSVSKNRREFDWKGLFLNAGVCTRLG